jgi:hypothetical protein
MLPQPDVAADLAARKLRKTLNGALALANRRTNPDRYRKHFTAFAHIWMLVLHVKGGNHSLRQSHQEQRSDQRLRKRLGLPEWISYSQLARSSSSRPTTYLEAVFSVLVAKAQSVQLKDPAYRLLSNVQVLDSSFITLCSKLAEWSAYKGYTPGVRLQTGLDQKARHTHNSETHLRRRARRGCTQGVGPDTVA